MDTKRLLMGAAIALAATTSQAQANTNVLCTYAPSQKPNFEKIVIGVGGASAAAYAILLAAGLTAVEHSSGWYIFTGGGGYVTGTLGGAAVAPWLITTSVIVGGAAISLELWCAPVNHPDAIKKAKEITAEFEKAVISANDKAIDLRDAAGNKIKELNNQAIDIRNVTGGKIKELNNHVIDMRDATAVEFRDKATQLFATGKASVGGR